MVFGFLASTQGRFWKRTQIDHLSTRLFPTGPSTSRRHLLSAHDHGRQRSDRFSGYAGPSSSSRGPDCTLSRLSAAKRWGARPAGDPVDGDPGARLPWSPPWIEPKLAVALNVSPHPGADGLVQDERAARSPEWWPFSPALPVTWADSRIGKDCRPRTTWRPLTLAGSPVFPPCAKQEVLTTPTGRYHGRTLFHPSHSACATPSPRCLHTRRFGTLESPPPPVGDLFCGTHPPGHLPQFPPQLHTMSVEPFSLLGLPSQLSVQGFCE